MTMRYPASVHPKALQAIIDCNQCEANRRPRMFVCEWHDGFDNGLHEADEAALAEREDR